MPNIIAIWKRPSFWPTTTEVNHTDTRKPGRHRYKNRATREKRIPKEKKKSGKKKSDRGSIAPPMNHKPLSKNRGGKGGKVGLNGQGRNKASSRRLRPRKNEKQQLRSREKKGEEVIQNAGQNEEIVPGETQKFQRRIIRKARESEKGWGPRS